MYSIKQALYDGLKEARDYAASRVGEVIFFLLHPEVVLVWGTIGFIRNQPPKLEAFDWWVIGFSGLNLLLQILMAWAILAGFHIIFLVPCIILYAYSFSVSEVLATH